MTKDSDCLTKTLSKLPESNYLDLDLSGYMTESNVFNPYMIPKEIQNKTVSLILPDNIEWIYLNPNVSQNVSQNFRNLRHISGKNVLFIDNYVFHNCKSLKSVDFPKLTNIGDYTFYNCESLKSIDFPKVTSIGFSAFVDCKSLISIKLPNVTSIYNYAFSCCILLESIDLPKLHEVDDSVFFGCDSLRTVNLNTYHIEEFMPEVRNELFD